MLQKTSPQQPALMIRIERKDIREVTYLLYERQDLVRYTQEYSWLQETSDYFGVMTVVLPFVLLISHLAGERISVPKEVDGLSAVGYWENLLYWTDWLNPLRNYRGGKVTKENLAQGPEKTSGKPHCDLALIRSRAIADFPFEMYIGERRISLITDKKGNSSFSLQPYRGERDKALKIRVCDRSQTPIPIQLDNAKEPRPYIRLGELYRAHKKP